MLCSLLIPLDSKNNTHKSKKNGVFQSCSRLAWTHCQGFSWGPFWIFLAGKQSGVLWIVSRLYFLRCFPTPPHCLGSLAGLSFYSSRGWIRYLDMLVSLCFSIVWLKNAILRNKRKEQKHVILGRFGNWGKGLISTWWVCQRSPGEIWMFDASEFCGQCFAVKNVIFTMSMPKSSCHLRTWR